MAFCNSCGAGLESDAKFCPKCGAGQVGTVASSGSVPATSSQSNTLKIVLIVVAAVVVLGALAIGTLTLIGLRIARHTRVTQRGENVRVETPFGTVNTNPSDVSRDLGVELYPGARMIKSNAANVQMAGMHTVAAEFESDDSADKVADFYKSKFPNATVNVSNQSHYTIVSGDKKNLITINIDSQDGKTLIHIANVSGNGATGSSSD
jgi:tRNA threonylcarbamoyladenosine modification (KEOPS) complex  Pcc1 subunit